jgi:hypothetical protein
LNTGTPPRVPLSLHRFAIQAEGIALRSRARHHPIDAAPFVVARALVARVRREPCALDINQTTAGRHIGRLAPPNKRAKASARASRGQAIDPNTQRTDMTQTHQPPRPAAALPQARACPPDDTERTVKRMQWNDTPDAIADCRACRPQSQHWRGFPATTASRDADHRPTTTNVTH